MTRSARSGPVSAAEGRAGRSAVLVLARVEGGRVLRHPLFLFAAAITAWWSLEFASSYPITSWSEAFFNVQVAWTPLYATTFLVMHGLTLRRTTPAIVEAFACVPIESRIRIRAIMLAGAVPVTVAVLLSAGQWVMIHRHGGLPVGDVQGRMPWTVLEAALAPVLTALAVAAGVALGCVRGSSALGLLLAVLAAYLLFGLGWVVNLFPANLISPLIFPVRRHPLGQTLQPEEGLAWPILEIPGMYNQNQWYGLSHAPWAAAGQSMYMLAFTVILTGFALHRAGEPAGRPSLRRRLYIVVGVALLVLGMAVKWSALGTLHNQW